MRSILRRNGYPEAVINWTISKKIARFYQLVKKRSSKMSCVSQTTLDWQHFAQVRKTSQI